ncbi:MAG: hypothetical protein JRE29_05495 [Deltaproteobacteria bacterium]|nr:hypothetical protein [Deltaproteobacteria bacterium]
MNSLNFWNSCRFDSSDTGGHYESYFQRANHPNRPLAFWIRYTIFSPKGRKGSAMGELWGIYFDGEAGQITAVKEIIPFSECKFSEIDLNVLIGTATLREGSLKGQATSNGSNLQWTLNFRGDEQPLLLLPEAFYGRKLPKAKALVGTPNAVYKGTLYVNGKEIVIQDWIGSQNHNWGSKHTDQYSWGQIAGFDNVPDAFLECTTARIKVGPLWTPWLTFIVLRVGREEFALNTPYQAIRAKGNFEYFTWNFDSRTPEVRIHGQIQAPKSVFNGLNYSNPPGGEKTCLNTKIASCKVTLEKKGQSSINLTTENRAAFEILTNDQDHGILVVL